MKKYLKTISIMLICAVCLAALLFVVPVYAETETVTMTEQELYNQTNTFNVNDSCFNSNGSIIKHLEENRFDTTQYHISYDMTARNDNEVMEIAQITVLTHGWNSNAAAWSNQSLRTEEEGGQIEEFTYDEDSLISRISEEVGGAYILWAKINDKLEVKLSDISDQKSSLENYNSDNFLVERITDISRHIVVVFDGYETFGSNDNIYYQFNKMMSKVIYDVKVLNGGKLPKVNLIGHSRGGITNMQYALDHPDLVASLVSLGTPYFASTTARLFGEKFAEGPSDGLNDILDPEVYYGYNTRSNANEHITFSNNSRKLQSIDII